MKGLRRTFQGTNKRQESRERTRATSHLAKKKDAILITNEQAKTSITKIKEV